MHYQIPRACIKQVETNANISCSFSLPLTPPNITCWWVYLTWVQCFPVAIATRETDWAAWAGRAARTTGCALAPPSRVEEFKEVIVLCGMSSGMQDVCLFWGGSGLYHMLEANDFEDNGTIVWYMCDTVLAHGRLLSPTYTFSSDILKVSPMKLNPHSGHGRRHQQRWMENLSPENIYWK